MHHSNAAKRDLTCALQPFVQQRAWLDRAFFKPQLYLPSPCKYGDSPCSVAFPSARNLPTSCLPCNPQIPFPCCARSLRSLPVVPWPPCCRMRNAVQLTATYHHPRTMLSIRQTKPGIARVMVTIVMVAMGECFVG